MMKLLSNIRLLISVALFSVVTSFLVSFFRGQWQWHWFGISGSIMTICGVILTIRPIFRLGLKKRIKAQNTIDGGSLEPTPEETDMDRQSDLDHKASQVGAVLAILGTIIVILSNVVD